jgi:shikimate kinase
MSERAGRSVALLGFRGCGKSTLGARLAESLARPFFDLDREIELAQGRPIRQLFEERGEEAFRAIEAETLAGVVARRQIVLAPGGGAILRAENRRRLREGCCCVFLDVDESELVRRLAAGGERPRLTRLSLAEEVRALLQERRPLYREIADAVLSIPAGETADVSFDRLRALVPSASQRLS